jgi:elongation factor Ts
MATIDMEQVKKLREISGAGVLDCKNALQEANGDAKAALEILQRKAKATLAKKSTRTAANGIIGSYVHAGAKVAVMVEVNVETDFAANNPEFQEFCRNVAMHIAAMSPSYVDLEGVPAADVEKQKGIFADQIKQDEKMAGKPAQVIEKIVEGKVKKWMSEVCLLDQAYVKDMEITVRGYLEQVAGKIRENMKIRRFVRFQVGEESL